ncbi:helix-turn-helix domain-containing protein [Bacillus suaedaesalsae]|uniref:Helix-turn-helix transcriptional regulator n=1 Tax=Bacillus suaedaesalsae TaxID=2810349 RepID=A0ABS2DJS5_9BACI|nr:helix-turn-helix transcriptional regulator [Bacillus suaedaesalsae]MBM6618657.1 helix-turn-helix transcriptional regulator [Bacillus suaedaesalsae]
MSDKDQLLTKLIGEKIREARQAITVNQEEFAHRIGIHRNNLGRIERGLSLPKGITIAKMITEWDIDITKIVQEASAEVKLLFPDEE